jgi:CBS domain-containing protein
MICPDCHTENIPGADYCESCGQDLHPLNRPSAQDEFTHHLLNDNLGAVEAKEPVFVAPSDPVALAVYLMQHRETGAVLVVEHGYLIGILTERDVLYKAAGERVDLNALTVRQLMTPDPVVLHEDDTLAVALHKMSVGGFRHMPLVADDHPIGMVSVRDLLRHVREFIHRAAATT